MAATYDTSLFVEIIESYPGIILLGSDHLDEFHIHFYQGLKGNRVLVDVSDEDIPVNTCREILKQLGLDELIERLFPNKPEENINPTPAVE